MAGRLAATIALMVARLTAKNGSGITPIMSIVRGILAREPNSRFFLFYGNRTTNGILFREALEELYRLKGLAKPQG